MDIMYERCCGLDVHKQTVVACVLLPGSGRQPAKEIRTFGTMSADLLELGDWLAEKGVTQVALESTGVYCSKPTWNCCWRVMANSCRGRVPKTGHSRNLRILASPKGYRVVQVLVSRRPALEIGYRSRPTFLSRLEPPQWIGLCRRHRQSECSHV
jgi:hypothetical protein